MTELLPGVTGTDSQKADVIYTATVLGFCAVHGQLRHQFAFEAEAWNTHMGDNDAELAAYQEFLDILSGLSAILDDTVGRGAGDCVKDGLSPTQDHHNKMICGWPGGQAMAPHARVFIGDRLDDPHGTRPSGPARQRLILGTIGSRVTAEVDADVGFCGVGAYTGAVMEEGQAAVFSSTTQCFVAPGAADRWTPPHAGVNAVAHHHARPLGLGAAPVGPVVGYSHGMNYAMRDALATSPTAVALEISSGAVTTKQASCFGCTTYMWACGFPPSATHLGSALSWHPIPAALETDPKKRAIVEAMNTRYHLQVHGYLLRGAAILAEAGRRSGNNGKYYVTSTHATIARGLLRLQQAREARAHEVGANYFLDACMDHKNDKLRIKGAILSHFDGRAAAPSP